MGLFVRRGDAMASKGAAHECHRASLPGQVSILGLTYRVKRKGLPDGEDGYIVPRKQKIVLGKHLRDAKAEQVLIHEVVHGILDQLGYLDLYEDERLVQGLAIGLHEALTKG